MRGSPSSRPPGSDNELQSGDACPAGMPDWLQCGCGEKEGDCQFVDFDILQPCACACRRGLLRAEHCYWDEDRPRAARWLGDRASKFTV